MCRHIYYWNIVDCDVKQQIHPPRSFIGLKLKEMFRRFNLKEQDKSSDIEQQPPFGPMWKMKKLERFKIYWQYGRLAKYGFLCFMLVSELIFTRPTLNLNQKSLTTFVICYKGPPKYTEMIKKRIFWICKRRINIENIIFLNISN